MELSVQTVCALPGTGRHQGVSRWNCRAGSTVDDLTDAVRLRYPRLAPPDVKIVVAVNADYAEPEVVLKPGDDVCLIPPVSGG